MQGFTRVGLVLVMTGLMLGGLIPRATVDADAAPSISAEPSPFIIIRRPPPPPPPPPPKCEEGADPDCDIDEFMPRSGF